jgi:hypothetical protein
LNAGNPLHEQNFLHNLGENAHRETDNWGYPEAKTGKNQMQTKGKRDKY